MRVAVSILIFICGVVVLVGVFLPWLGDSGVSGWDVTEWGNWAGDAGQEDVYPLYPVLALIGGALMAAWVLAELAISRLGHRSYSVTWPLGAVASLAALTVGGGLVAFVVDALDKDLGIGYGVYVCAAAAAIGLFLAEILLMVDWRRTTRVVVRYEEEEV